MIESHLSDKEPTMLGFDSVPVAAVLEELQFLGE